MKTSWTTFWFYILGLVIGFAGGLFTGLGIWG